MNKAVVAIDFGTSGTTYAFSFLDSKEDIMCAKWSDISNSKNLTEIILDEQYGTIKFGKECQEYLSEQSSSEKNFYHFSDIKMRLYKNETRIKANNNDEIELDIDIVISKILLKIKEIALKEISSLRPAIKESEIKWIVTVPAIWSNKSKEIMQKASIKAGIFDEPLTFFALEPEAAACDYSNGKVSDKEAIKPGNNYIVCDIGGGTIDISTHRRIINNGQLNIEEIYHPIGGACGSTYINKLFMKRVIEKIFGIKAIDKLTTIIKNPYLDKDLYIDYCIFLEEIENFKITIKKENINESKRINCSFFKDLISDISASIDNYNKECKDKWKIIKFNKDYKIYFPYQIMIDLTEEVIVLNAVKYIKKIIQYVEDVKSIIYAGSVSSNDFIISMIKEKLPANINNYLSPYPSTSIAKGAVIFGFDPYIIKSRVSKYTIGISAVQKWDKKRHGKRPDLKFFCKIDNCYKCKSIFSPIIFIKDKIDIKDTRLRHYKIIEPKGTLVFYKTIYYNVNYIDETFNSKRKCIEFGRIPFDLKDSFDPSNKDLIVELKLGGTFIDAKMKYKGIEKSSPFNFANYDN